MKDIKEKILSAEKKCVRATEPSLKTSSPSLVAAKFSGFIFYDIIQNNFPVEYQGLRVLIEKGFIS